MPGKWDFSFNDDEVLSIYKALYDSSIQSNSIASLLNRFSRVLTIINRVRGKRYDYSRRTY